MRMCWLCGMSVVLLFLGGEATSGADDPARIVTLGDSITKGVRRA